MNCHDPASGLLLASVSLLIDIRQIRNRRKTGTSHYCMPQPHISIRLYLYTIQIPYDTKPATPTKNKTDNHLLLYWLYFYNTKHLITLHILRRKEHPKDSFTNKTQNDKQHSYPNNIISTVLYVILNNFYLYSKHTQNIYRTRLVNN